MTPGIWRRNEMSDAGSPAMPDPTPRKPCRKHLFGVGSGKGPCPTCGLQVIVVKGKKE